MMSSTLGAPLGGTTVGGHHGLESLALRLIVPPNFGGGFGRYLPSMVVVASGEPGVPVVCVCPVGEDSAFFLARTSCAYGRRRQPAEQNADRHRGRYSRFGCRMTMSPTREQFKIYRRIRRYYTSLPEIRRAKNPFSMRSRGRRRRVLKRSAIIPRTKQ